MIDETDKMIIKILENDARTSYTNIADKLKVSEGTIRHRVSKMEEKGIIEGYEIKLNPQKMGFTCPAIVGVDVEPDKFLKTADIISDIKKIRNVFTCTGDHMILFEIWLENQKELYKFLKQKIESIEGLKRICPAIILNKLK
ncbi:MAG: winged helix-turn-helix transcriptional regulator [Candidatus Ranarchaeia archaeon]